MNLNCLQIKLKDLKELNYTHVNEYPEVNY